MKNILTSIASWFRTTCVHEKKTRRIELENRVCNDAKVAIQITEYNGTLYVCHNGLPLIPVESLKNSVNDTLSVARQVYVDYKLSQYER